jgi:hypothetical protein
MSLRHVAIIYVIFCVLFVLLVHLMGSPEQIYIAALAAIDAFAAVEPLTQVPDWDGLPTVTYY